jgi:endonuclease/exonuclease/phosphatase family metal-dependent hydrolase
MQNLLRFILCIAFVITLNPKGYSQDLENSYITFANHTNLYLTTAIRVTGSGDRVSTGNTDILPFETCNHHELGDRVIAVILDIIFNIDIQHKNDPHLVKFNRAAFSGGENFAFELDILHESELLFTILLDFTDQPNTYQNPCNYNIRYPDGTLDKIGGYSLLYEQGNHPHQAQRDFVVDGIEYNLIYGGFDMSLDPTDNVIFSLSEKYPVSYNMEPNILDAENPAILNVLTYNIGLLMPANSNDQEEMERIPVMHLAIPKNMDIIIWQEMFEQYWVNRLIDSLISDYPYHTSPHNEASIPGITKNGGALIMSKFPILEEADFSYLNDGGIEGSNESVFADKGVKYAKIDKLGQIIHVFNTHTSGQPEENDAMGNWIRATVPYNYNDIVIMGGDMNTRLYEADYYQMMDSLEAVEPTYNSLANEQIAMRGTTWGYNHFNSGRNDVANFIDYVFAHKKFKVPTVNYNETQAYRLNVTDKKFWGVFDMGDHQPVYSRMEFPTISSEITDNMVCPGDNFEIVIATSLEDYEVEWYKDGVLLEDEEALVLSRNSITESDWGFYECFLKYEYVSNQAINGLPTQFPAYVPQGIIEGKLHQTFSVGPDDEICGIVLSIVETKNLPFVVYPNPANKEITIETKGVSGKYEIYNTEGKSMTNGNIEQQELISIQHWATGTYTIQMVMDGKRYSYSFIKQ